MFEFWELLRSASIRRHHRPELFPAGEEHYWTLPAPGGSFHLIQSKHLIWELTQVCQAPPGLRRGSPTAPGPQGLRGCPKWSAVYVANAVQTIGKSPEIETSTLPSPVWIFLCCSPDHISQFCLYCSYFSFLTERERSSVSCFFSILKLNLKKLFAYGNIAC